MFYLVICIYSVFFLIVNAIAGYVVAKPNKPSSAIDCWKMVTPVCWNELIDIQRISKIIQTVYFMP